MFKIHASLLHNNKQRFAYEAGWLARQAGWQGWLVGEASWLARLAGWQGWLVGKAGWLAPFIILFKAYDPLFSVCIVCTVSFNLQLIIISFVSHGSV